MNIRKIYIYVKISLLGSWTKLGGGNSNIFGIFTPNIGEDDRNWLVETTTNR